MHFAFGKVNVAYFSRRHNNEVKLAGRYTTPSCIRQLNDDIEMTLLLRPAAYL